MTAGRHQVVVVGGGFGGVNTARALARADVDVTVVDRTNHHLFQPLLYQVATGILPEGLIAPPLRTVLKKQSNARVLLADVTALDLDGRTVAATAPDGRRLELPYDTLVVAAGAGHAYFGRDEWERFAPGMKTLEDARHLRTHILSAFEMAELSTDPRERRDYLTFVVVGAGPTGVELVGQLAELAHKVLPRDYRRLGAQFVNVMVFDHDLDRARDTFAQLAELAAAFGLRPTVEAISYSGVSCLADAAAVVGRSGGGLHIDPLHLQRAGESAADIRSLDPALVTYYQLCDAPLATPVNLDRPDRLPRNQPLGVGDRQLESRALRLMPGDGELPLADIVAAVPPGLPVSAEVPNLPLIAELGPAEFARRARRAVARFLDSRPDSGTEPAPGPNREELR